MHFKENIMSAFNLFKKNKEQKELEIIVNKLNSIGKYLPNTMMTISLVECKELIYEKLAALNREYKTYKKYATVKSMENRFKVMSQHYDTIMQAISHPKSFSAKIVQHPRLFIDFFTKEEGAELLANWEQPYRISINERGNWVIKSIKRSENNHSNE